MQGRLPTVATLSIAIVLAGCVQLADVDPASAAELLVPPDAYGYACGGEASAEPCSAKLADLRTAYQEPYAAADRTRPGTFAIGMNAGPSEVDRAMGVPDGRTARCQNDLLVTEDDGATWRYVETPRPAVAGAPLSDYCGGDPALLFDAEGVLHHTGIATSNANLNGFEIYYTKSADLGATWSDPVVLSEGANEDRNWIGLDAEGRIYVAWQHFNDAGGSLVSTSADGGDTWSLSAPEDLEECFTVSPVVFEGATMLLACSLYNADAPTVRVVAFDPVAASWETRADLAGEGYWPKLAWAGDALLLFVERFAETVTVDVATSADGGRTWSAFSPASAFLPEGFPQQGYDVQWATTDPWGRVHLILSGWETLAVPMGVVQSQTASGFAHAVLANGGALLATAQLGALSLATDPPRAPDTIGTTLGNHYMGLEFNAERGLAVWSRDGVLEYAFVEPAGA